MEHKASTRRIAVILGTALGAVLLFSGVALAATTFAVTKTAPKGGATGIAPAANVKAFFNNDINASTVTSSTFKIRQQGTTTWLGATRSVNNTITPTSTNGYSEGVATLNPRADLAPNTTYEVRIVGGSSGIKDVNGNALATNKSWTFTTAGTTPTTPPDTTIDSGPEGTVASTSATFAFHAVSSGPTTNATFQCSLDGSPFTACASPKEYPGPLSQGDHNFRVKAIDASGTEDPSPATRDWKVNTIVLAAPTITSPQENGFVGASFTLSGTAEANATVEIFEGTTSKGTTQANGSGLWSKALSGVSEGTHTYTAKATDAAGNTSSASDPRTVTVDTTPPTVNDASPANGATGVSPNANVTATFSEAMDLNTLTTGTFTLKEQGSSSQLGAAVSYASTTKKATLDPSADLTPNTTYTATLTTGVKDSAGNAMVQEKTWSFTTGANPVSSVTITPTTLDLSVTESRLFYPCEKSGTLTVTNNGKDQVDFWEVSITGSDAQYFSTGSQNLLLTYDYLGLPGGSNFKDEVKFKAGQNPGDRSRSYFATLTYIDGNGATIGSPVSLTATARCLSV